MSAPLFTAEERRRLARLRLRPARPHAVPVLGDWRSRRFGATGLFADHRDYVLGDDLRYVDWNVYARHGELMVKRFEAEEAIELLLLVDRSASMQGAKSRAGRRLAGALGLATLGHMDRVRLGWMPSVDRIPVTHLPGRGSIGALIEALERAPDAGATDHDAAVRRVLATQRRRALAVVVSDFYDPQGAVHALARLRGHGMDVVALHMVDADDVALPLGASLRCRDQETGAELDVDVTPDLLDAVRTTWRRRARSLEAWCVRRGAQYHRIDVRAPLWSLLPRLLGARVGRGGGR